MSSDEAEIRRPRAVKTGWVKGYRDHPLEEWIYKLPKSRNLEDYHVVDKSHTGIGWAEPVGVSPPPSPVRSHRSGTCFDIESTEMRTACVEPLRAYLGADAVVHEVRHQQSAYHTDLVFADADGEAVLDRLNLAVGTDPLHDPLQRFRVWWYVKERGPMLRQEAIEDGRYTQPSKNRKHVEWLLDHGYLARTTTGHVVAVEPPKIGDLHAVELKLRDWETALDQADRANRFDGPDWAPEYQKQRYGYADYRWVALDAGAIPRALEQGRETFEDRGVGLLAVAEGGTVVEHIEAEHAPRHPYTRDRAYVESQVWAQLDAVANVPGPDGAEPETESEEIAQPSLVAFQGGQDG